MINKKSLSFFGVFVFLFLAIGGCLDKGCHASSQAPLQELVPVFDKAFPSLPENWDTDGICIFPDAQRKPWLDAMANAKNTIRLAAYRLADPEILKALCDAADRGIHIKLFVDPQPIGHEKTENTSFSMDHVKGRKTISAYYPVAPLKQTHHKLIIVDDRWAMVSTGNLDKESFDGIIDAEGKIQEVAPRDFAITITNPDMVKELITVFDADIEGKPATPQHPQLIWGPSPTQKQFFLDMIASAKQSIHVYQQSIQDEDVAKALAAAAKKGTKVEIMMVPFPFSKKNDPNIPNQDLIRKAGGIIHLKALYIHAKIVVIDANDKNHRVMYLGSLNFYEPSFKESRELGVITNDPAQIEKIMSVFKKDVKGPSHD
ncbi:phospholipase D-like domain-containing protein [Candidatus Finniella inopinata]|uniref:Phospholipase D n=1 Tax=Candidatus Finniella inopinata TaxID=1696036 RepID=A0A4V2DZK4_9PROT|nr:phospholipase D-like domain-containing protein [Candidatus Finniella inopinata]RZI45367.1 hypothetical protein EQU50_07515 [Candidatus Finniella inopinata]